MRELSRPAYNTRSLHRRAICRRSAGWLCVRARVPVGACARVIRCEITWVRCFSMSLRGEERRCRVVWTERSTKSAPQRDHLRVGQCVGLHATCTHACTCKCVRACVRAHAHTHVRVRVSIPVASYHRSLAHRPSEDNGDPIAKRPRVAFTARARALAITIARWFRNSSSYRSAPEKSSRACTCEKERKIALI